jgi:hypothetical protein
VQRIAERIFDMKKRVLLWLAVALYTGAGSLVAQEKVTAADCELMIKKRDTAAIQRLIKNPDVYENTGITPPIMALAIKAKDLVLIRFMFDLGMSREYSWHIYASTTYLQEPIRQGDFDLVQYLLNFCEILPEDAGLAVIEGKSRIVELFIEKGFDFRKAYWQGGFPSYASFSIPMFTLAIQKEKYGKRRYGDCPHWPSGLVSKSRRCPRSETWGNSRDGTRDMIS